MTLLTTKRLDADANGLETASSVLAQGGLVAFPTETVYGLGADACNDTAVASIYAAKGRPSFNPLIAHVSNAAQARELCEFDDVADRLAATFWPGALTLVLPLKTGAPVSKLVTAGLQTLAVRVPDHPVGAALLKAFGGPVAAPSANPSGRISPTTAAHVLAGLDGKIDAIVDGGACGLGVESTIIQCGPNPVLLRAGGIPAEALEACLGFTLQTGDGGGDVLTAPGQMVSHYAPNGVMRLNVTTPTEDETYLGFGACKGDLSLSVSGDLQEAAANLFDCLHQLDALGAAKIAVAPIPDRGLGRAINDRLRRAAAPRD